MKKFNCLVVNAGSSSLKFKLYKNKELVEVTSGICEKIGLKNGFFSITIEKKKIKENKDFKTHYEATQYVIFKLIKNSFLNTPQDITIIVNRIVHGGSLYKKSKILSKKDIENIKQLGKFAPLHNPPAITVIKAFNEICSAIHIGVFDTSFHQSIPRINYEYAIPKEFRNKLGIRKYGMHGTSYRYITIKMKEFFKKKSINLIICHLGNGASLCAVKNNLSFNTSMGLTPLAGLVMGTRSGDIDPSIFSYLQRKKGLKSNEIENILNTKSGVKAFSGLSDMRDLEEDAKLNKESKFAFEIWSKRIADYISMYLKDLNVKIDALIFTAGIGENSSYCRSIILEKIKCFGFTYCKRKNKTRKNSIHEISNTNSKYKIYIVQTNEELMMALDGKELFYSKKS